MANRLKWLVGAVAACALIVALVHSIDIRMLYNEPVDRDYSRLATAIHVEERMLRETVWADSLLPRVPAAPGLKVEVLTEIHASSDSMLRAAINADSELIDAPAARVALFIIPDTVGQYYTDVSMNASAVYYADAEQGARCVVAIPVNTVRNGGGPPGPPFRAPLLGPCHWWAVHGAPGPRIAAWLRESNGYSLGFWTQPPTGGTGRRPAERRFARRHYLGTMSPFALSCIKDEPANCVRAFMDPLRRYPWTDVYQQNGLEAVPVYRHNAYWREFHFDGQERYIFAQLQHEFGAARFRRFWQSDRDVDEAFADAFGVSLGSWLQRWARARFPGMVQPSGEQPLTLTLSLLTLVLLGAAAVVEAQRRQIR